MCQPNAAAAHLGLPERLVNPAMVCCQAGMQAALRFLMASTYPRSRQRAARAREAAAAAAAARQLQRRPGNHCGCPRPVPIVSETFERLLLCN